MSTQDQEPGADPARKSSFDQPDRERIRAALFRYMEEHRVGVPTLIAHMAKAIKRDQRYIPQKTLQRFLAGEMRTNDASVAIFHEFASKLPAAKDDLAELALALGSFFKPVAVPGGPLQSAALPLGPLQTYSDPPQTIVKVHLGTLTFLPRSPGQVRLTEQVFPPVLDRDTRPAGEQSREGRGEHFEGIATSCGNLHLGVLRSSATRRPRVHWFTREQDNLKSFCQSAPLQDGGDIISEELHFGPRQQGSGTE
jgi:hypothetical protein